MKAIRTRSSKIACALWLAALSPSISQTPTPVDPVAVKQHNSSYDAQAARELAEHSASQKTLLTQYCGALVKLSTKYSNQPAGLAALKQEIANHGGLAVQPQTAGLPPEVAAVRAVLEKTWERNQEAFRGRFSHLKEGQMEKLVGLEKAAQSGSDPAALVNIIAAQKAVLTSLPDFVEGPVAGKGVLRLQCGFGKVSDGLLPDTAMNSTNRPPWSHWPRLSSPNGRVPEAKIVTTGGNSALQVIAPTGSLPSIYWTLPYLPVGIGSKYKSVRWGVSYKVIKRDNPRVLRQATKEVDAFPAENLASLGCAVTRLDASNPMFFPHVKTGTAKLALGVKKELISEWHPIPVNHDIKTLEIHIGGWGQVVEIDDVFIEFK